MKLSIITINRNNAEGLKKTLDSVANQTCKDFEHIIIDGASTDDSVEVIKRYVDSANTPSPVTHHPSPATHHPSPITHHPSPITHHQIKWVSEPDKGIYNAMNKGIRMTEGEYIQILNSGDCLANDGVIEKMLEKVVENYNPEIIYGNMIKIREDGRTVGKSTDLELTMLQFYVATLNHDCAYIRRNLFDEYGLYDENLKIVSDWKWYIKAIVLGKVKPIYVNVDVTIFEIGGISSQNIDLCSRERREVFEKELPQAILSDYDRYATDMLLMDRLRRRHLYNLVRFIDRIFSKFERLHILK